MFNQRRDSATVPQDLNIDGMSLISLFPVNIETQTPEQVKFARRYNLAFPDIEKMILGPILVLIFFLAFNAIANLRRGQRKL